MVRFYFILLVNFETKDLSYKMKSKAKLKEKKFGVIFFPDFIQAKTHSHELQAYCDQCDQLNLVVEQEGDMDDPSLLSINPKIKVYAGEAWTLIHKRRLEEGWYLDHMNFKINVE